MEGIDAYGDALGTAEDIGPEPGVTEQGSEWRARGGRWLSIVAVGAAIFGVWELLIYTHALSALVLPSPPEVYQALVRGLGRGIWLNDLAATVKETVLAFAIGGGCALFVGVVFAFVERLRVAFYPWVLAAQNFPKIAIAPVLITWLGYGIAPKVAIGGLLAFFPIMVNTIAGLREIGEDEVDLLRSVNATFWQQLRYLRLPNALAFIFPSLTVAAVGALLGVIVGEFVGAKEGLGYIIVQKTFLGDIAATYGVLVLLAAIGSTIFAVLHVVERRTKFRKID
jgi:NitT/TauT family transport system permease protein